MEEITILTGNSSCDVFAENGMQDRKKFFYKHVSVLCVRNVLVALRL